MERTLTDDQRRELAGRARTLHERLDGPPNDPGGEPPIDPDAILAEWKDIFPDEAAFRDRLAREGLAESTVREQLGATRWPDDEPLPGWIDDVEALIAHVHGASADERSTGVVPEGTPFAALLGAVARYARDRLPREVAATGAVSPMVEWFVARLEMVCVRPLYVEFKSFVEHHDPELARADPDAFDDPPTTLYERFVDAVLDGGFADICLEYPVLARHLVRLIDQWVEAVTETYRRVEDDLAGLRERFGVGGDPVAVEPLAEDNHARGRVPVRVSFESGEVIYKPRSVAAGEAFYAILDRLDDHLPTPSPPSPTFWSRGEYGWMEPVEYRDPADEAGVERYYRRAGTLLCLTYVFNFSDVQFENVIAAGDCPTIIDGETVFHPDVSSMLPVTSVAHAIKRSVLLSALLPVSFGKPAESDGDGFLPTIAGLGRRSGEVEFPDVSRPVVDAVNTDVMTVRAEHRTIDRSDNTPTLDGRDRPPEEYVDEIVYGFEEAYETVRKLHADGRFLGEIVDLDLVGGIENRLVYRESMQYMSALQDTLARDPLRDGARTSLVLEQLTVPIVGDRIDADRFWSIYDAERAALRRLDVPRFTASPDDRTVYHDGSPVGFETDATGYACCRRRLDAMDGADRRRQVWLIRRSFEAAEPSGTTPPPATVTDDRLREAAIELFDDALDAAIETDDGRSWVSLASTGPLRVDAAGPALYHGRGGIALSAAALHRATGRDGYRRQVAEILDPVVADVPAAVTSLDLGATRGIGSVAYALSVVADLLDEDAYREAALAATREVTDDRLAADDTFDVMEGTAGALLGLLAYHDRFGGSEVLDRALACGERLLDARVPADGHRVWETIHDDPIPGFAHGVGGIAYALARLAATADEPRYGEAARDAFAYDSAASTPAPTDVADSGAGHDRGSLDWCHGRAGDALARIGAGERLGDERLLAEASETLSAAAAADPSPYDNLCCGNLGRVEALLVGSRRVDADLPDGTDLAGRCLARRDGGTLDLPGHATEVVNPTFFDGVAGAAYALLRLRDPDALPSVLLLE